MKLNLDCVRQILLCVEEHTGLRKSCYFIDSGLEPSEILIGNSPTPPPEYQIELLQHFDNDEIIYHINYCIESGLLSTDQPLGLYRIFVSDLTPKGHDFLENIRDNKIWDGVKNVANKIGAKSLDSVFQISTNIMIQLIKAYFNI